MIDETAASEGGESARPGPLTRIGRYVIEGVLGSGGTATVYLARDPALDRAVALKVIRADGGARASSRLVREGQAIARISHPNVIHVYEVGREAEQLVYVAMERIDGVTLDRWLASAHDRREILEVLAGAGRGLAAAHAAGLVHRDFKPVNVMVGRDRQVRVLDFGLARTADDDRDDADAPPPPVSHGLLDVDLTVTGTLTGTPAYMSPEQWRGQRADARSDQFSFCVALYRALTGRHPFDTSSRGALEADVLAGRIPAMPRSIPRRLRGVLRRGLAVRPEDRHPSMEPIVSALVTRPRWIWPVVTAVAVATIALVATLLLRRGETAAGPVIYASPQRITSRGDVGRAAVSPDGSQIALLTQDALIVQPLEADAAPRILLRGRPAHHALSWSPDGRQLALVASVDDRSAPPGLLLVDVDTGAHRALTTNLGAVALLPDGELVAAHFKDRALAFHALADPETAIRSCPLPGDFSGIRTLLYDPRSDRIVVQIDQGDRGSTILRVDRRCAAIETVAGPIGALSFVLRPSDGRILVRVMYEHDLFELDAQGRPDGRQHVLQTRDYVPIAILPDGSVVHVDTTSRWQLVELGDHAARTDLVGGASESRFAIAPDGRTVAQVDGVYRSGVLRVGSLDEVGGLTGQIASGVVRAAWSPDGARLAILSQTRDGYAVSTWDRAAGAISEARPIDLVYDAEMAWLDDHRVGFCTPPSWSGLRWIDVDTGELGRIAIDGEQMSLARAHRDDRLAFVTETTSEIRVWSWRVDEAPRPLATVTVTSPRSSRRLHVTWAHDDAAVYLFDSNSGEIWSVATDGAVTALPPFTSPRGGGFTQLQELFSLPGRLLVETVTASGDVYVSAPR